MEIQLDPFVDSLLRWSHILAGSFWLGLSMFFLLIAPVAKLPTAHARTGLWWMQAAATKTLVLGIALFYWSYMRLQVGTGTGRTKYIMYGMMFGVVMWALLMFVVAPAQRKILSALEADKEAPASTVRRAAFVSKLNGLLVGPMLLLMVFANNYATFSYSMLGLILVIGVVAMGGTMAMSCVINRRQK